MSGLDVAAELQRRKVRTRVIIVTTFARSGYLRRALDAGATGYLLKDKPADQLAEAVRRVHRGLRVIDPELAAESWGTADPLTERERQALRLAADGATSGDIALKLNLSEGTVRNYLSEAINKLGASNRIEAATHRASAGMVVRVPVTWPCDPPCIPKPWLLGIKESRAGTFFGQLIPRIA